MTRGTLLIFATSLHACGGGIHFEPSVSTILVQSLRHLLQELELDVNILQCPPNAI